MIAAAIRFDLLGHPAQLERPELLWLLAAALAVGVLIALGQRARAVALRRAVKADRLVDRVAPGLSPGRAVVRGALTVAALALFALALAGPQWGDRAEVVKRVGIDLVVAIDASRSMQATDVLPSRLQRAKLELSDLLDRLHGDRVGLVVFAGDAFAQCPLTTDYGAAKIFLRAIDPESMPSQGTAVAAALRTAGDMLEEGGRGAKSRAVLLLTDGEDHEGDVPAAAKALADKGVVVYTVGVATPEGAPVPVADEGGQGFHYLHDKQGNVVVTRLDETQLRSIASATGGSYFGGRGGDIGMGEVTAALDRLEKTEMESRLSIQYASVFEWFAMPGLLLLALGAFLPEGKRR